MSRSRAHLLLSLIGFAALATACNADRLGAPQSSASRAGTPGTPAGIPAAAPTGGAGTSGRSGTSGDPTFLTASPTAPTIANPVIAFWAKKGVDQTVRMFYHARLGHNDSTTFMLFRVRAKSLVTRPDGTPIANGDSVLITATLIDPVQLKVDFQPSGLRFATSDPAVLKFNFGETVRDLNGDGVVNALDLAIQRTFRIWRRESLLDPWSPLPSVVVDELNEVDANIGGFTGYAAAY